jgi:hypothetical protein
MEAEVLREYELSEYARKAMQFERRAPEPALGSTAGE